MIENGWFEEPLRTIDRRKIGKETFINGEKVVSIPNREGDYYYGLAPYFNSCYMPEQPKERQLLDCGFGQPCPASTKNIASIYYNNKTLYNHG